MPNPRGVNQYTKGSGKSAAKAAEFKRKFGRNPKKGESGFTPKNGSGPRASAFKAKFGRLPKQGERDYGK